MMKTWNDYKEHVKSLNSESRKDIEEIESIAAIVGAVIEQRKAMGITQRELAALCGIPQPSVARIESYKTTPNLDTLLKIMRPLGLKLTVTLNK
jgi:ribosome-binding protein aMBF1 (putative translation factor)